MSQHKKPAIITRPGIILPPNSPFETPGTVTGMIVSIDINPQTIVTIFGVHLTLFTLSGQFSDFRYFFRLPPPSGSRKPCAL